jgi:hypothetical protein
MQVGRCSWICCRPPIVKRSLSRLRLLTLVRIRRVKCDETKPQCLRCLQYCGTCEGYIRPPESKHKVINRTIQYKKQVGHALIAPAPVTDSGRAGAATSPRILRQLGVGPAFQNSEEHGFFQIFLNITSPTLSGAFDDPVWRYLLPQHSANEPFIRYGVEALGAMSVTFMEVMAKRMAGEVGDEDNCLGYSETYQKAITLYGKSLHHMQSTLSKPRHSIRDVLLACLLVVGFEGFHGHNYVSTMHSQKGLDIFYSWLARQPALGSHSSPLCSPNRTEVEDDLVASMHRLDLQVLSFFDSRPAQIHTSLADYGTNVLKSIPSPFISLAQARSYWDLICRRTYHLIAFALRSTGNTFTALMLRGPTMSYPDDLGLPTGIKLFAQSAHIPTGHELESTKCASEIGAWIQAYGPIYKQISVTHNSKTRGATILLIHAKMTRILLAGTFFKSEMEYDSMLPEFQSIYALAASIWSVHVSNPGVSYNFELGLLPPLFLVATRCRDRTLRSQVINLLFTAFHRESCWDSVSVAYIARWLKGMEEDKQVQPMRYVDRVIGLGCQDIGSPTVDVGDEVVPEERRVRIGRFNVDLNMRRAQLEFTQGPTRGLKEPKLQEYIVKW